MQYKFEARNKKNAFVISIMNAVKKESTAIDFTRNAAKAIYTLIKKKVIVNRIEKNVL